MNSAIFQMIIAAIKFYCPFVSCRCNLRHLLLQINFLSPTRLEPIINFQFIHDLIAKILKFAVQELNHQPVENPGTDIINLPIVIDFLMQEIEGWSELFDLETIPQIFNDKLLDSGS